MIDEKPKTTGTKQRDLLMTTDTWGMDAAFTGHTPLLQGTVWGWLNGATTARLHPLTHTAPLL